MSNEKNYQLFVNNIAELGNFQTESFEHFSDIWKLKKKSNLIINKLECTFYRQPKSSKLIIIIKIQWYRIQMNVEKY